MSATSGSNIRSGFAPLAPGFTFAKFNELASFEALLDEDTAAVLIEPIQGERGIRETDDDVLRGIRQLCDERGILLMLDEVQSGMGRTGRFFSYESAGIKPDAIALAKGLGGGFPIGAIWVHESHADLFKPGSHGTTFGGSPLACAAAHAVLDVIEEEKLIEKVAIQGASFKAELEALAAKHPNLVKEVRGRGYLLAMSMKVPSGEIISALRKEGLIAVPAGDDSVRLLPPLNATEGEITEALEIIDKTLSTFPTVPKT
jgi:acetylornithine aminotransferase/acetylornithine/N-succinyldiaminopimelate aminotransferase